MKILPNIPVYRLAVSTTKLSYNPAYNDDQLFNANLPTRTIQKKASDDLQGIRELGRQILLVLKQIRDELKMMRQYRLN